MTNVLVFPCGSEIGLEIHRALQYEKDISLYGLSSVDDHGKYVYANYIDGIPYVSDEEFIPKIVEVIKKYKIDVIFPAHDSVLLELSNHDLPCELIGSSYNTNYICRRKSVSYNTFEYMMNVPKMYSRDYVNYNDFPIFLKPDIGQGSVGTVLVNNRKELNAELYKDSSLLILEYLPGKEYTVDCFSDKDGVLKFCGSRERKRIKNGISVNSSPVHNEEFQNIAKIIQEKLKFIGPWFFQLKENKDGYLSLLEIASRISGTMGLNRNLGVNFPLLSIHVALGRDIDIIPNTYDIEVDRALISRYDIDIDYENVYVDLDDTLIIDKKINEFLLAFLYQCQNKNKNIYLISKHIKDPYITLMNKHIDYKFFKTIIHIETTDNKYKYIKPNSIFIDDSFAERRDVYENCNIPTFSTDGVEGLFDWRR